MLIIYWFKRKNEQKQKNVRKINLYIGNDWLNEENYLKELLVILFIIINFIHDIIL